MDTVNLSDVNLDEEGISLTIPMNYEVSLSGNSVPIKRKISSDSTDLSKAAKIPNLSDSISHSLVKIAPTPSKETVVNNGETYVQYQTGNMHGQPLGLPQNQAKVQHQVIPQMQVQPQMIGQNQTKIVPQLSTKIISQGKVISHGKVQGQVIAQGIIPMHGISQGKVLPKMVSQGKVIAHGKYQLPGSISQGKIIPTGKIQPQLISQGGKFQSQMISQPKLQSQVISQGKMFPSGQLTGIQGQLILPQEPQVQLHPQSLLQPRLQTRPMSARPNNLTAAVGGKFHGQPVGLPHGQLVMKQGGGGGLMVNQGHNVIGQGHVAGQSMLRIGQPVLLAPNNNGGGDKIALPIVPKPMNVVLSPSPSLTVNPPGVVPASHKVTQIRAQAPPGHTYQRVSMNGSKFQYIRLVSTPSTAVTVKKVSPLMPKSIQPAQANQHRYILPVTNKNNKGQLIQSQIVQAATEVVNSNGQNITQYIINPPTSSHSSLIQGLTAPAAQQIVVSTSAPSSAPSSHSGGDPHHRHNNATPSSSATPITSSTAASHPKPAKGDDLKSLNSMNNGAAGVGGGSSSTESNRTDLTKNQAPRQRKPCNCNKSQCLKLYCDCFANGEFCQNCNCTNCANNLQNEDSRSRAIKNCLERNPMAFHPKIGKGRGSTTDRRHTKGCNCKRSSCLKNYCECYEAKIMCTSMCKCFGCKNVSADDGCNSLMHLADVAAIRDRQVASAKARVAKNSVNLSNIITSMKDRLKYHEDKELCRQPYSFVNSEVAVAASNCLLARAEEMERLNPGSSSMHESVILEEFERCIKQVIQSAVLD